MFHDPLVAKLVLIKLYSSIRTNKARFFRGEETRLQCGIASLLASQSGGPAFVGCLHELALSEENLTHLPSSTIASSAKRSGNLHSGVRLLEKQLMRLTDQPAEPTPGKLARRGGRGEVRVGGTVEETEVRILLSELYGLLGEEDVVRGLAAQVCQSEHTRLALAAEARGDSEVALRQAEASLARPEQAGEWELKLAARVKRQSLLQLSLYGELSKETHALMQHAHDAPSANGSSNVFSTGGPSGLVNPAEEWVRLWVLSRCKQPSDGHGLGKWPDEPHAPLAPQPAREGQTLLRLGYGPLLLMDRLASEDLNGARAMLPLCAEAFIERWATLHPLATSARRMELRPLQVSSEGEGKRSR